MNPILARFQDQPALIDEGYSAWLEACLSAVSDRMGEIEKASGGATDEDFWREGMSWLRPYHVRDGILQIPVKGVLLNDFPYAFGSWATGYEYIWQAFKRGIDDSSVRGIALVVNSGGGMVAGNFDLVDRMYEMRGRKPVRGFAAEHAYSAAYSIVSVADRVTVARTGGVGSIGVVVTHYEMSRALDERGITINIIRSKPGKMEGNPLEVLSEGARERMQERVDEFHKQFVAIVARNRGMEKKAVDDTDALTFMAHQAISNGLADEVGALDDAITAFAATLSEGEEQMADISQADHDQAVAAALASGRGEGAKEGATNERVRINSILALEEAQKRPVAARSTALNTEMTVEQAQTFLASLPEEGAKAVETPAGAGAPAGMLAAAMNGSDNPTITAGGGDEEGAAPNKVEQAMMLTKGPRKA